MFSERDKLSRDEERSDIIKYPTIKFIRNGVLGKKDDRGQRSAEAFLNFVKDETRSPVVEFKECHSTPECRALQLMQLTDNRLSQGGCDKLELALLSFFEQFRNIYIGDQVQKTSRVYRRLSEVLGLIDESTVLSVIISKVITNLKYWGSCVMIAKLEEVGFLLSNHTAEHYPFLGVNVGVTEMRCRSMFYTSLGKLLMVDLGEDEDKFEAFMIPLTSAFEQLGQVLAGFGYNSEEVRKTVIGLARDVRGLAFAFNTKTSYMMLFDWIYPAYTPILQRAVEIWYQDPHVTTPILKLFAELVQKHAKENCGERLAEIAEEREAKAEIRRKALEAEKLGEGGCGCGAEKGLGRHRAQGEAREAEHCGGGQAGHEGGAPGENPVEAGIEDAAK